MNKTYILDGAQTDFERNWTKEGKGVVALLKEAMTDGLQDTCLSFEDIVELNKDNRDACYVGNFIAEQYVNQGHLGSLLTEINPAFYGIPSARYEAACASSSVALDAAITKISNGDYDVAIVVDWELMKTVDSKRVEIFFAMLLTMKQKVKTLTFLFQNFLASWPMKSLKSMEQMRNALWMR